MYAHQRMQGTIMKIISLKNLKISINYLGYIERKPENLPWCTASVAFCTLLKTLEFCLVCNSGVECWLWTCNNGRAVMSQYIYTPELRRGAPFMTDVYDSLPSFLKRGKLSLTDNAHWETLSLICIVSGCVRLLAYRLQTTQACNMKNCI